jgi:hypothetical protein
VVRTDRMNAELRRGPGFGNSRTSSTSPSISVIGSVAPAAFGEVRWEEWDTCDWSAYRKFNVIFADD